MVTNLCYGAYSVSGAVLRAYCYCLVASLMSDYATLWTVVHQAPLSMGFSRQEYWSGLPCPPVGNLPNPGIEPYILDVRCVSSISYIGKWVLYH